MAQITADTRKEVQDIIYDFFSEECEVERSDLNDDTNIIEDLEGDSLMFLELLEIIKAKFKIDIQLQTIGKYMIKNPAETIGKVTDLTLLVIEYENGILDLEMAPIAMAASG